jgi:hypothetical protein
MRRTLLLLLLIAAGTGCRDQADNLARDYRNLINESIDALMMIDSEAKAQMMVDRVLKPLPNRLKGVGDRVRNWKQNAEKTDYGQQLFTSDSVIILKLENEMNKERLDLEAARLQKLRDALMDEARQGGEGDANPKTALPNLSAVIESDVASIRGVLSSGTELLGVLEEVRTDEKLLKSGKMQLLKDDFDKKLDDFKQNRIVKIRQS